MLEELKVIMETLGTATGAAKQFGIFWLSIQLVEVVFGYVLGGAVLYSIVKIIHRVVTVLKDNADEVAFVYSLRMLVEPNTTGDLYSFHKNNIFKAVKRGMEKKED